MHNVMLVGTRVAYVDHLRTSTISTVNYLCSHNGNSIPILAYKHAPYMKVVETYVLCMQTLLFTTTHH